MSSRESSRVRREHTGKSDFRTGRCETKWSMRAGRGQQQEWEVQISSFACDWQLWPRRQGGIQVDGNSKNLWLWEVSLHGPSPMGPFWVDGKGRIPPAVQKNSMREGAKKHLPHARRRWLASAKRYVLQERGHEGCSWTDEKGPHWEPGWALGLSGDGHRLLKGEPWRRLYVGKLD